MHTIQGRSFRTLRLDVNSDEKVDKDVVRDVIQHHKGLHLPCKDPTKVLPKDAKLILASRTRVFDRELSHEKKRKGYLTLLNKINESNTTVKLIRTGCYTLFDQGSLRHQYSHPQLSEEGVRQEMADYLQTTKPQRFKDELERSINLSQSSSQSSPLRKGKQAISSVQMRTCQPINI